MKSKSQTTSRTFRIQSGNPHAQATKTIEMTNRVPHLPHINKSNTASTSDERMFITEERVYVKNEKKLDDIVLKQTTPNAKL